MALHTRPIGLITLRARDNTALPVQVSGIRAPEVHCCRDTWHCTRPIGLITLRGGGQQCTSGAGIPDACTGSALLSLHVTRVPQNTSVATCVLLRFTVTNLPQRSQTTQFRYRALFPSPSFLSLFALVAFALCAHSSLPWLSFHSSSLLAAAAESTPRDTELVIGSRVYSRSGSRSSRET